MSKVSMKTYFKRVAYISLLIPTILLFGTLKGHGATTIRDIVYKNEKKDFTVYVYEDKKYVPFLVLTNYYDGNTLLLRKEIMDTPRQFNRYSSYYENSSIDRYLNKEYLQLFSEKMKNSIVSSNIEITTEESLGAMDYATKTIGRKVFLLSVIELSYTTKYLSGIEGKSLRYFKNNNNRIAYWRGKTGSWALRTPDTWYLSLVCGIAPDSKLGSGNAYDRNGIRPAFCVSNNHKIERKSGIVKDKDVYVLSMEE